MKRSLFSIFCALLISNNAEASAFYFTDIGVRSFSRGGAFIAGADDLTALYYNPAALTRLDRPQFMLNVAGVDQFVTFSRAETSGAGPLNEDGTPSDIAFDSIEDQASAFVIPHFGVSSKLGSKNTTFAFGFYPPYAPDLAYDPDGAQRYSLIDVMIIQTSLGPTVAHKFNDWISVGVGAAWGVMIAEQELKVSVPFHKSQVQSEIVDGQIVTTIDEPTPNEDPANDVGFKFAAADWKGISYNAGLTVEPPDGQWAFGLMVQPPVKFEAKGELSADFSSHILATEGFAGAPIILSETSSDKDVTLNITMPLILKAGFAFRPDEDSEIEIAGVWQNWSSIQTITITDLNLAVDLNGEHPVPDAQMEDIVIDDDVNLPADYKDSWSIRLGCEDAVNQKFTMRAGVFYETSGVPASTQSVTLVDGDKVGYGIGGSYRPTENWSLDFGVSQSFLNPTTAANSEVKQISVDALTGDFLDGTVIGNGKYESSLLIFGAGLVWEFGPRA